MRTIYDLLFGLSVVIFAPLYLFKLWRRGNWREGFGARFGRYSSKTKQALTNRRMLWLHGVSVGEAGLAILLARALKSRVPQLKLVVSTTTTTGMGELQRKLPASVEKIYYPVDRRTWVRRAFSVIRPEIVVLVEGDLWPNFSWHARRRRVPVVVVNGRVSDRSLRGYRRWQFLFRGVFENLAGVTAQSEIDARRFVELGCKPGTVESVGSLKFESHPPADARPLDVPRLLRQAGMPEDAQVLLAGSTHEGEEALLAEIFLRLRARHPKLFLVLVPRHHERCRSVAGQLHRRGVRHVYRSEVSFTGPPKPGSAECLLVNSTGELRQFYPHADVVFIGKSLVGQGGQNPIEPAAAGRALVFGPHMQNFADIAPRFLAADGAIQVADAIGLESTLDRLFSDASRREELGRNARAVVESNRGALDRTVEMIVRLLEERGVA